MSTLVKLAELLLTPSAPVILIGILIIIGAPLLLHLLLSSSVTYTVPPTILLVGPENSGKTSLLTLLERSKKPADTHTSQISHSVELNASTDATLKSSFRNHDDSTGTYTKFLLTDTPGHGKLRKIAMEKLRKTEKVKGIVFMVDAAALGDQDVLASATAYLYEVLLYLQKRANATGKAKTAISVLIAANKMDLFTALPPSLVKKHLENELTRLRASRSKGLLDSGVGVDEIGSEEQDSWLGEVGSETFAFDQLTDFDIDVEVAGGSVQKIEPDINNWWWWMAQRV